MKLLIMVLSLVFAAPSMATYGHANGGQGELVQAHEALATDAYIDLSAGNAHHQIDELVEMCNQYANHRQVVLRVNHQNSAQVVRVVKSRARLSARENVRVVFVQNSRRVVSHRNQVRVVVRSNRARLVDRVFNRGFFGRDRVVVQRVLSVRVRG